MSHTKYCDNRVLGAMASADFQLNEYEVILKEKDVELRAKDSRIAAQQDVIRKRDTKIAKLLRDGSAKNAEIQDLRSELEAKTAELAAKELGTRFPAMGSSHLGIGPTCVNCGTLIFGLGTTGLCSMCAPIDSFIGMPKRGVG